MTLYCYQLPPTFKKDFTLSKNIKKANLRNRNDFHIPRVKSIKIGVLPPHNFPKIWYENKRQFSKLSNINLISNLKQNFIEDFYQQNKYFNSNTCYMFAKVLKKAKTIYKEKTNSTKRVKEPISFLQPIKSILFYIEIIINNKYVTFLSLSFSFLFLDFYFYILLELGENIHNL